MSSWPNRETPMTKSKNRDFEFEERLYEEYGLEHRAKLTIILSAILYASFLFLDWVHAPRDLFPLFLYIRLAVLGAHLILYALLGRVRTKRGYAQVAIAVALFDLIGIAAMIFLLGGFTSAYVQGLYIIIMAAVVA